jgi:hypothetical protein
MKIQSHEVFPNHIIVNSLNRPIIAPELTLS